MSRAQCRSIRRKRRHTSSGSCSLMNSVRLLSGRQHCQKASLTEVGIELNTGRGTPAGCVEVWTRAADRRAGYQSFVNRIVLTTARHCKSNYLGCPRDLQHTHFCTRLGIRSSRKGPSPDQDLELTVSALSEDITANHQQLGPRSTGQLATAQPLLLVTVMGKLYPSTTETTVKRLSISTVRKQPHQNRTVIVVQAIESRQSKLSDSSRRNSLEISVSSSSHSSM
jgi:hypothetical protein